MSIKRIGDVEPWERRQPCSHPEHRPPTHIVLESGEYENECPGCGEKTRWTVTNPTWTTEARSSPSTVIKIL